MTDPTHRDRGKFVSPKPGAPAGGYPRDPTPNTAAVVLIGASLTLGLLLMVAAPDLVAWWAGEPPVTFQETPRHD